MGPCLTHRCNPTNLIYVSDKVNKFFFIIIAVQTTAAKEELKKKVIAQRFILFQTIDLIYLFILIKYIFISNIII